MANQDLPNVSADSDTIPLEMVRVVDETRDSFSRLTRNSSFLQCVFRAVPDPRLEMDAGKTPEVEEALKLVMSGISRQDGTPEQPKPLPIENEAVRKEFLRWIEKAQDDLFRTLLKKLPTDTDTALREEARLGRGEAPLYVFIERLQSESFLHALLKDRAFANSLGQVFDRKIDIENLIQNPQGETIVTNTYLLGALYSMQDEREAISSDEKRMRVALEFVQNELRGLVNNTELQFKFDTALRHPRVEQALREWIAYINAHPQPRLKKDVA